VLFSQYRDCSWERSHQPFPGSPGFLALLVPLAQAEGGHPLGEEGTVEQGHLLGVVVVVVVDVDGCRDPADDEGDPAGDQVEPARGERCHRTPGASPRRARHGCRQHGLVRQSKSCPSLRTWHGGSCPSSLLLRGAGARGRGRRTAAWVWGPAGTRPRPAAAAPSRSPPCKALWLSPPSTAAWRARSSAR